ncbi:unnamed protein product, partial [Prorocentrum cordatum]
EATGGHARRPLGVVTPLGKTVTMTLRSYCTYLRRHRDADDPLYLFDSGELAAALFHSCLASCLERTGAAPAHQWAAGVLAGPGGRCLADSAEWLETCSPPPRSPRAAPPRACWTGWSGGTSPSGPRARARASTWTPSPRPR